MSKIVIAELLLAVLGATTVAGFTLHNPGFYASPNWTWNIWVILANTAFFMLVLLLSWMVLSGPRWVKILASGDGASVVEPENPLAGVGRGLVILLTACVIVMGYYQFLEPMVLNGFAKRVETRSTVTVLEFSTEGYRGCNRFLVVQVPGAGTRRYCGPQIRNDRIPRSGEPMSMVEETSWFGSQALYFE